MIQCNTGVGTPLHEGVKRVLQDLYFSLVIVVVLLAWTTMHSCDPRIGSAREADSRSVAIKKIETTAR